MALFGLHLLVCLLVHVIYYRVDAFTCNNVSEVFARVNATAHFNYSIKGQLQGVATFQFIGPSGILGLLSYNSKSAYLSIQNVRDVRINADWNGNVGITKSHVTSSDLGLYSLAKVGRESRECSFLYILDRPTTPNIISQYTRVGENSTLICNSTSTTYPSNHSLDFTFNWWVDNETIINRKFYTSSGNLLIITNLTEREARSKYTCIATENIADGYNSEISDDSFLNITYGPDEDTTRLSLPDSLYTLNEGTFIRDITCTSNCFPLCYYRWVKQDHNTSTVIVNDSGVLSLGVVDRAKAAKYICTVSNPDSLRSVSKEVSVLVRYGPDENTTTLSPSTTSYTVDEHSLLSPISCNSECYPKCVHRWIMIASEERKTVNNTRVLSLGMVDRNHTAIYVCAVTNPFMKHGFVTRGITLYVRYGPDLPILNVESPFNITEGEHSEDIICSARCYPTCFNTWTNVSNGLIIGDAGSLTFGTVNRYQAGVYKCTSHNIDTKNSSHVTINVVVKYAPDVSVRVSTTNLTKGANITLFCEAVGVPSNYTYRSFIQTWDGTEINNSHTALTATRKYSSVDISSLQLRDSGTYVCSVNNGILDGKGILDQNASAVISVKVLPKVFKDDLTFFGSRDGQARLVVPVYSDPVTDSASLTRNGNFDFPLDEKYSISYRKTSLNVVFYDKHVTLPGEEVQIVVNNLTDDDFGNYILALRNSLGQTTVTVVILPESEPFTPKVFTVRWRNNTAVVLWEKGHNGGHEQSFVIQTLKDGTSKWLDYRKVKENENVFNESFYMINITNLKPGAYRIRIIATNIIGASDPVYLSSSLEVDTNMQTTKEETKINSKWLIIGAASGSFVLVILVSIVAIVGHKKRTRHISRPITH